MSPSVECPLSQHSKLSPTPHHHSYCHRTSKFNLQHKNLTTWFRIGDVASTSGFQFESGPASLTGPGIVFPLNSYAADLSQFQTFCLLGLHASVIKMEMGCTPWSGFFLKYIYFSIRVLTSFDEDAKRWRHQLTSVTLKEWVNVSCSVVSDSFWPHGL